MYTTSDKTAPLGYVPHGNIYYVRGNNNGTADVLWCIRFHNAYNCPSPLNMVLESVPWGTVITNKINAVPSDIYPELKIQNGEIKIIVECAFHYVTSSIYKYKFTANKWCKDVPPKTAFGFYMLDLPTFGWFFNNVEIFTPKPGLFDETPPK
jgi:hypothetical protein